MTTKICEYCGNTSGKENQYGQCISCGGNLTIVTPRGVDRAYPPKVQDYTGISGSSYTLGETGMEVFFPVYKTYFGYRLDRFSIGQIEYAMEKWDKSGKSGNPPDWFVAEPDSESSNQWIEEWASHE